MFTQLQKIGFIPTLSRQSVLAPAYIPTLQKAGVSCTAFDPQSIKIIRTAAQQPGFIVGVYAVTSAQEAREAANAGARFMVGEDLSSAQQDWAHEAGLACVCAKQLLGGICPIPAEIASDETQLTRFLKQQIHALLGFDLRHVGINCPDAFTSSEIADQFEHIFGFPKEDRGGAFFAGEVIEVMKKPFYGMHGHIAIATRSALSAAYYLEHAGVKLNWDSAGYNPDGRLRVVYLQDEIGGFAVHILQK